MQRKKIRIWSLPLLFVGVMLINYLSATGIIFPNTQAEVSDKYVNLLAPAGFTFSIWSVIYFGVILSILGGFIYKNNDKFYRLYQKYIVPLFWAWMTLNIIWIVSWSYEWLFISVITIFLYAVVLFQLTKILHQHEILENSKWWLTYPIGLHAGWLIIATSANLTTLFVKAGMNGTGTLGVVWALGTLSLILGILIKLYTTTKNATIFLPTLWALIGVIAKHRPNSSFQYANISVFYGASILFFVGLFIYLKIVYNSN